MANIITFDEALEIAAKTTGNKHLLLGNGFSMAYDPTIFSYGSLLEQVEIPPSVKKLFDTFKTKDFERIIQVLNDSQKVLESYGQSDNSPPLSEDVEELKKLLVKAITKSHPDGPQIVDERKLGCCANFLEHFEKIYSLNYDLLLYWSIMHSITKNKKQWSDGFRQASEGDNYVVWDISNDHGQNVYYLHGALHLFDCSDGIKKLTWSRTGISLKEQLETYLEKNEFPLIVAEGESKEKYHKISHFSYLHRGLKSLSSIGGNLFIYGHSLDDNDEHIFKFIKDNKVKNIFISIFNADKMSESDREQFITKGKQKIKDKTIYFYEASSAKIWN
ncbi:MAG: DUF4917 family protein [Brevinema sp.]